MEVKELSKKGLKDYSDYLTVGRLKEFLNEHNLPDDAKVVVERVEDSYYEKGGWGVYLKEDSLTPGFPNQYTPVWSCVRYKDDKDILFLDLHY